MKSHFNQNNPETRQDIQPVFHTLLSCFVFLLVIAAPPFLPTGICLGLTGQINVNTATAEELQRLPFIGKARARAIVEYRDKHGHFKAIEEVGNCPDIGMSTFQAIKPYLKLSGETTIVEDKEPTGRSSPDDTSGDKPSSASSDVRNLIITRPGEIVILPDEKYYETLIHYIRIARQSIHLAMFLFKITDSPQNRPAIILNELIAAKRRGVEIKVVLEKSDYDDELNKENGQVAKKLKKNQIAVSFDSPKTTTHAKLAVVDDRYCFAGSHNLTHSALASNHEFSLLIDSKTLAGEIIKYIETIR